MSSISRADSCRTPLPLVNHAEERDEAVRRDAVVEVGVERLVVFDAAREIDAANAVTREHLLRLVHLDEIDQQIRCQVAARHDHVARQVANPHRLADGGVHLLVGVAARRDAKGRAIDETRETGCGREGANRA